MHLVMSEKEKELFAAIVAASTSYFEFGMGGSTVLASELVKGRVVAIDSDAVWVRHVAETIAPSDYERRLIHVDIGATKEWGFPVDLGSPEIYEPYCHAIREHAPRDFDLCFVDGRFRVACFLSCLKYTASDTVVCIHDYRMRPYYHGIEEFARPIAEAENLTAFVRRRGIDVHTLELALRRYAADPQ